MALTSLTVAFQEPELLGGLNSEHAFTQANGFWFQLSVGAKSRAKVGWGPGNPQALNRYAYVLNNPVRYTDPTGHCPVCIIAAIWALVEAGLSLYDACNTVQVLLDPNADDTEKGVTTLLFVFGLIGPGGGYTSLRHGGRVFWQILQPKKLRQAVRRGWSPVDIESTIDNPAATHAAIDRRNGEPATAYYRPDGHYIVRNDNTGEIIAVSDRNNPNWYDDVRNQIVSPINTP